MKSICFSENKKFIFTIIDVTYDALIESIYLAWDLLYINDLPNRSKGDSLLRPKYKAYILDLQKKEFEIALHKVRSGYFDRPENIEGLKTSETILGQNPKHPENQSYNPDNMKCGPKRFCFPQKGGIGKMYSLYDSLLDEGTHSKHFRNINPLLYKRDKIDYRRSN